MVNAGTAGTRSLWLDTAPPTSFPALEDDRSADVAVIGGGITGLTTALYLALEGCSVALVEARHIGAGATGNTSAKVTSQHGLKYPSLLSRHGEQTARAFARAQEAAKEEIGGLAEGIECDYRVRPAFVYASSERERDLVEQEARVAAALGLPASFVDQIPAPVPAAGAVRFEHQAELHPQLYIIGLARRLEEAGGEVFERTRALEVSEGAPCVVRTDRGSLRARHVVVATLAPILDRGLFFAREFAQRSYVIAAPLDGAAPDGMFISGGEPIRSFRSHRLNGSEVLLVGGEGHPTGSPKAREERYDRLEAFAREHWDVDTVTHRWSAQDFVPADRLPFVGPINPWASNIHVATGYGKWGLTSGTLAAILTRDAIFGRKNPLAEPLSATRLGIRSGVSRLVAENGRAMLTLVADGVDSILRRSGRTADELRVDEGGIVSSPAGKIAAYRDREGALHAVSRRCTHLGCPLTWNAAERTWDCPCHGSRFGVDGDVLEGPAVHPLSRREPR